MLVGDVRATQSAKKSHASSQLAANDITAQAKCHQKSRAAHRNATRSSVRATGHPQQTATGQALRRSAADAPPRGYPAAQALRDGFALMMPLRGRAVFNNRYL